MNRAIVALAILTLLLAGCTLQTQNRLNEPEQQSPACETLARDVYDFDWALCSGEDDRCDCQGALENPCVEWEFKEQTKECTKYQHGRNGETKKLTKTFYTL